MQGAPLIILPLTLFSGFFINSNGIPVYFYWIRYFFFFFFINSNGIPVYFYWIGYFFFALD